MKTLILIVVSLIYSSNTLSQPLEMSEADVKAQFEIGEPALANEIIGWHSGRCFSSSETDSQYGMLLVGLNSSLSDEEKNSFHYLFTMTNTGGRIDAFDNLSSFVEGLIESSIDTSLIDQLKPLVESQGSLVGGLDQKDDFPESTYWVRKRGEVLLVHGIQGTLEEWCYTVSQVK